MQFAHHASLQIDRAGRDVLRVGRSGGKIDRAGAGRMLAHDAEQKRAIRGAQRPLRKAVGHAGIGKAPVAPSDVAGEVGFQEGAAHAIVLQGPLVQQQHAAVPHRLAALHVGEIGIDVGAAFIGEPPRPRRQTQVQPRDRGNAKALLSFVGYQGALATPAQDLPHVDRRLVEIARALATHPRVLLLDEPAAGLTRSDKAALSKLIRRIADLGVAVILVEHDMTLVMGISDQVVVLDAGAVIASGKPADVRRDPEVRRVYLGESR